MTLALPRRRHGGETRFTLAATMIGHWALGLPATILHGFTLRLGVTGLWWGFVLGLSAIAVTLYVRSLRVSAREILPLAERAPVEADRTVAAGRSRAGGRR